MVVDARAVDAVEFAREEAVRWSGSVPRACWVPPPAMGSVGSMHTIAPIWRRSYVSCTP